MSNFRKILTEVADLKERKSQDYQGSSFNESDYFPYGQQSFNHMLWTKILRIRSTSEQPDVNFESVEDSLKDLIAYATMNIEWLRSDFSGHPKSHPLSAPEIPPEESAAEFHQHPADEYREKTIDELRGRRGRT